MTSTLLQNFQIPPPPEAAATEQSLPLAFFDIPWLHFQPIRRLIFYEFPCSKSYFIDTLIPKLNDSLSTTLKHYVPVAGNLLYPINTENKPIIRFTPGDSVSLTVAESNNDFDNLIGNHTRDADQFYDFVPELPLKEGPEYKSVPVVAVKVTLFPGHGICIGFANLHSFGDASSIVGFIRAWAEISKSGGDEEYLIKQGDLLPLFDKSVIKDPKGIDDIYWSVMKNIPFKETTFPLPTGRNRVNNKDEVLKGVENWMSDFKKYFGMRD
ncbi:hypothetical protein ACJIZ3_010801 [Penstemon smallii]|uniref:Uncharacterized protein n=1 Tax=Penstemon smallii TaxID=265156 RepID=A0ABD3UHC7_9LAMI